MLSKQFFSLFIHHASIAVTQIMRRFLFDFVAFMWSAFDMYYDCVRECVFSLAIRLLRELTLQKWIKFMQTIMNSHINYTHTRIQTTEKRLANWSNVTAYAQIYTLFAFHLCSSRNALISIQLQLQLQIRYLHMHLNVTGNRKIWLPLKTMWNLILRSRLRPSRKSNIDIPLENDLCHYINTSFYDLHLPHSSISNEWLH